MKRTIIDLLILTGIVLGCNVIGFITGQEPHAVAVWGLIGWLLAKQREAGEATKGDRS